VGALVQTVGSLLHQGVAHHQAGRRAQAEAFYRQVLSIHPDHPDALNLLGVLAHEAGDHAKAAQLIRKAIAMGPKMGSYHANLALALAAMGKRDEAVVSYRAGLALNPGDAEAHYRLGTVLLAMGKADEALQSFASSIRLRPGFAGAYNELGNALKRTGMLPESAEAYRQCLQREPASAEAWSNLADVLRELRQLPQSLEAARNAVRIKPDFAGGWSNLGSTLKDLGRMPEAMEAYEKSVRLDPASAPIRANYLYSLHFHSDDPASIMEAHREFDRVHCTPLARRAAHMNDRSADRVLRIGYVSADFRSHSIGRMLRPLFANHDHGQFHITCYSDTRAADGLTAWLRGLSDTWVETRALSDEELAARVEVDKIDVLVDLALHMANNRLLMFARKPAPVQMTYAGYPATTGLRAIDFRITDAHLDPVGETERFNSEKLLRLDASFWCHWGDDSDPRVGTLPAIESGVVTFGSLNNPCKVSPAAMDLWAKVLSAVPGSRLMLLTLEPIGESNYFTQQFSARGIDASRLRLITPVPRQDYLELYNQIDIGLDPLPYNGHMTSCDSFWMGVPVVTIRGETSVGRGGISLLRNLDLPELIAETPDEFVSIAGNLARELPRLSQLRGSLRERMRSSPLCDAKAFTRNMERLYRDAWRKWCAG